MLFNSYIFILLFLPLVLVGYYTFGNMGKGTFTTAFLLVVSLCFVGYQSIYSLIVLLGSILLNFLVIKRIESTLNTKKKRIFVLGIILNLSLLFVFKYMDFFIENINTVFGVDIPLAGLAMPLGISFYTFSQIACLVDCYKETCSGKSPRNYSLTEYGAFVSLFPKLIQGPIASHEGVVAGFRDQTAKKVDYENLCKGIYAFALGLAKKVLIADTLAKIVNIGYSDIAALNTPSALLVMVSYSLQIYFDFSGYCDMAYGIGYMLNLELPINFNSPYKAESISDFWERWHITLTEFFTRYLYIPLGGSRKGQFRTIFNVMVVFLLSGLWHGANWTFVLWGALNGVFKVFERITNVKEWKVPKLLKQLVTFIIATFAWSIFRSDSISQAWGLWARLLSGSSGELYEPITENFQRLVEVSILYRAGMGNLIKRIPWLFPVVFVFLLFMACLTMKNTKEKVEAMQLTKRKMAVVVVLMVWSIMSMAEISEFIYFNF